MTRWKLFELIMRRCIRLTVLYGAVLVIVLFIFSAISGLSTPPASDAIFANSPSARFHFLPYSLGIFCLVAFAPVVFLVILLFGMFDGMMLALFTLAFFSPLRNRVVYLRTIMGGTALASLALILNFLSYFPITILDRILGTLYILLLAGVLLAINYGTVHMVIDLDLSSSRELLPQNE